MNLPASTIPQTPATGNEIGSRGAIELRSVVHTKRRAPVCKIIYELCDGLDILLRQLDCRVATFVGEVLFDNANLIERGEACLYESQIAKLNFRLSGDHRRKSDELRCPQAGCGAPAIGSHETSRPKQNA